MLIRGGSIERACWRAVPVAVLGRSFRLGSRLRCGRCAVLPLGGIDCGVVWMAGQPAATPSREHKGERQGRELLHQLSQAWLRWAGNSQSTATVRLQKRARLLRRHGVSRLQKAASERFNSSCSISVGCPSAIHGHLRHVRQAHPNPTRRHPPLGDVTAVLSRPVTGFIVAPWPYTAIVFPVPAASVAGD